MGSMAVPWSFITGLLVAFLGAFFAHLLVYYRNMKVDFDDFSSILIQIYELDEEDLREAHQAARKAKDAGVGNSEVPHPGSKVWRLRKRLQETVQPCYPFLDSDTKEAVDQIDSWITKLDESSVAIPAHLTWITGGAGDALENIPFMSVRDFLYHYFLGNQRDYQSSMEKRMAQQADVYEGLRERQSKLDELNEPNEYSE